MRLAIFSLQISNNFQKLENANKTLTFPCYTIHIKVKIHPFGGKIYVQNINC